MPINKKLTEQLVSMMNIDQAIRKELNKIARRMSTMDRKHTGTMKKIIEKYGWPGTSLVGKNGAKASWLLIQHATHDLEFQKNCLKLLEKAAKQGEVENKDVAYLTDRILVLEHKKQIYGTQFMGGAYNPYPIQDPANLDSRRKRMGLEPFKDNQEKIAKKYK